MFKSLHIIWVLLTFTRGLPVSQKKPRSKFKGFVGESMILPFSFNGNISEGYDVHWRYNGKLVYDITNGTGKAGPEYQGRVTSFPSEYKNGNYSIQIKNLQSTDEGIYEIYITGLDFGDEKELSVKDRPEEISSAKELSAVLIVALTIIAFGFIICAIYSVLNHL